MATRTANSSFLRVHWVRGDYKGAIDYLPTSWFSQEGIFHDLSHEFLGTDYRVRSARCSVANGRNVAELDYGGKYFQENQRNLCDPGILKIVFKNSDRVSPKEIWWAEDGRDFELGFAVAGLEEDIEAQEGSPKLVSHLKRERSTNLREKKIEQVLARKKELRCEACNFSFQERYGSLGGKFCEVHHRNALAATGTTRTGPEDLAILCSNCHRMIHLTDPMMSVEKFAAQVVLEKF
jgi:hypothetical protein